MCKKNFIGICVKKIRIDIMCWRNWAFVMPESNWEKEGNTAEKKTKKIKQKNYSKRSFKILNCATICRCTFTSYTSGTTKKYISLFLFLFQTFFSMFFFYYNISKCVSAFSNIPYRKMEKKKNFVVFSF